MSSTQDTLKHKRRVLELMSDLTSDLIKRACRHDDSKLKSPEKEGFDKATKNLAGTSYGSEEYEAGLREIKDSIKHHYSVNRHHPEHFDNGIHGMNILDIIEMLLDWIAASERHKDGNILRSIEHNRERFNMSEDMYNIFMNSVPLFKFKGPQAELFSKEKHNNVS